MPALADMLEGADPDTLALVAVLAAAEGPESLAAFMAARGGEDLDESRISEGFTGVKTDSLGREIHYADGVRVKGPDGDDDDGGNAADGGAASADITQMKSKTDVVAHIKAVKAQHAAKLKQQKAEALADVLGRIEKGSGIPAKKLRHAVKVSIEDFGKHQYGNGLDEINNAISVAKSANSRSDLEEVQARLDEAAEAIGDNVYLPEPDEIDAMADRLADETDDWVDDLNFQPSEDENGEPESWDTYAPKLARLGIEWPETSLSTSEWFDEKYDEIRARKVAMIAGWLRSDTPTKKTEDRGPPPFPDTDIESKMWE